MAIEPLVDARLTKIRDARAALLNRRNEELALSIAEQLLDRSCSDLQVIERRVRELLRVTDK